MTNRLPKMFCFKKLFVLLSLRCCFYKGIVMAENIVSKTDNVARQEPKKRPVEVANEYAEGLFSGLLVWDDSGRGLLYDYMTAANPTQRDELAALLIDILKNYADTPDKKGNMKHDKYYNLKIAAMERRLSNFKLDDGTEFFTFALRNNPELALFVVQKFNDTYGYLNVPDVISYFRYKDMPTNKQRRNLLAKGQDVPTVFDVPAVRRLTDENNRFFDFDVKAACRGLESDEKFALMRAVVLSNAASVLAQRLGKGTAAPKHVNAFKRLVANYPDILDMPVDESGKTAESLLFGLNDKHLKLFFNRPVKMERLKIKDGMQKTEYSGYTIAPEEFLARSLRYGDKAVKMVVTKTSDVFTDKKRQREQIENTALIAADNPEYMEVITKTFDFSSAYEGKDRLFPLVIKEARQCGVSAFAHAVCLALDRQQPVYRNKSLDFIEESFWQRSFCGRSRSFEALAEAKILRHYERIR